MIQYLFNFQPMNYRTGSYFFVLTLLAAVNTALAQEGSSQWKELSDVTYVSTIDPLLGYEIESPVFGEKVTALAGKKVTLKGYIVPLEEMRGQKYFVLSSLPYNICFFCGGAGPETVVEVYSTTEIPYQDNAITISGTLELNQDDPLHLMYILKNAELIKQ